MSEYTEQAESFLKKHGITFKATMTPDNKCPLWCDPKEHMHGNRHRCTFTRTLREGKWVAGHGWKQTTERFSLMFWNSYNDARTGAPVEAYDVLSGLTKSDPGTFQDFCGEYGYDEDSRKALTTYKAVVRGWEKVERFFTAEEIEELWEIN